MSNFVIDRIGNGKAEWKLNDFIKHYTGVSEFKTLEKNIAASFFLLRVTWEVFCLVFLGNFFSNNFDNKIFLIILIYFVLCKQNFLKTIRSLEQQKTHFPRFYFYFLFSENLDIKTQNKNK